MAKYSCAVCERTRKQTKNKVGAWARDPSYDGTQGMPFVWCCGECFNAAAESATEEILDGINITGFRVNAEQRDKTLTEMIRLTRIRRAEDFVAQQGEQAK